MNVWSHVGILGPLMVTPMLRGQEASQVGEAELIEALPVFQLILSILAQPIGLPDPLPFLLLARGAGSSGRPSFPPGPSGILDHGTECV